MVSIITDKTPITRVYSFERFLGILVHSSIPFSRPTMWDDPWEVHLLKNQKSNIPDKLNVNVWGSCWTMNIESDFAWKAYAPNKNGILVHSTIGKVKGYIEKHSELGRLVCDPINYSYNVMSITEEKFYIDDNDLPKEEFLQKCLFTKRRFFKPENEFRFMIIGDPKMKEPPQIISVNIDINDAFQNITLDPRISLSDYETYSKIIGSLGYTNLISSSRISSNPKLPEY